MFDEMTICPYPGLRSFTEEESLYFKGRDDQIGKITELLQKNKFLMVTGASGDGKSSVVFAGLIPNARAGFFRSRYNKWSIANFRPERSPVRNFAGSLAPILHANEDTLFTELNRGFSSLVDLYKNSALYAADTSANTQREAATEEIKRSASNLMIVVDQFEEFFTNNENFYGGVPSQESQVLVNLLLETSRIALKEDLPIYVVFTMRSDFIGQCASFRGLPEMIGFSQFFVPRLKRNELQQIIEEPAELNGNTISRRLVERLLYDISEGLDQLPMLQHALNQIWHMADNGKEEMDLVHYAMVGGMNKRELPDEDIQRFQTWYDALPEHKKGLLEDPGLNRVLDYHANNLYEGAWEYYRSNGGKKEFSRKEVKYVIAMTFACLTKIDDSRAVRNIMTLGQITRIINRENIGQEDVNIILNYFREEGNTFIRPFISEDGTNKILEDQTALDITHESLIRNWEKLKRWAFKEFEYFETWVDFRKQMVKWLESSRSSGYLLPIGPLTFFEDWYKECRPNKYWIERYERSGETDPETSLGRSGEDLDNAREFLRLSARKVRFTRTYLKYGTAKLAGALAIVVVIFLSLFYYNDSLEKLNSSVLDDLTELTTEEFSKPGTWSYLAATNFLHLHRAGLSDMVENIASIDSVNRRMVVGLAAYDLFLILDKYFSAEIKGRLIDLNYKTLVESGLGTETNIEVAGSFIHSLAMDNYFNQEENSAQRLIETTDLLARELSASIREEQLENRVYVNQAFSYILTHHPDPDQFVNEALQEISPFSDRSKEKFERLFPVSRRLVNGRQVSISHQGGYQVAAYLFAQQGDIGKVIQSTDTLLKYNGDYWQTLNFNNGFNVLGYLLQYKHFEEAERYVDYLLEVSGFSVSDLFVRLLDRTGFIKYSYSFVGWDIPTYHTNLNFIDDEGLDWIFEQFIRRAEQIRDPDERNYRLAMVYKNRGVYTWRRAIDKNIQPEKDRIYADFDKSLQFYGAVSTEHLSEEVSITLRYYTNGFRNRSYTREYMYSYPDQFDFQWYNEKYISNAFIEYLLEKDRFNDLYKSTEQIENINDWLANYNEYFPYFPDHQDLRYSGTISTELLSRIYESVRNSPSGNNVNMTLLDLELSNRYFKEGAMQKALEHYNRINHSELQITANRWEYLNLTYIDNLILGISTQLALNGDHAGAKALLRVMPNNNFRSVTYSYIADRLYSSANKEYAFQYLDSAVSNGKRVDPSNLKDQFDYRYFLINTMAGIGGNELVDMAFRIAREMPPNQKAFGVGSYIIGLAVDGKYYLAREAIPDDFPSVGKLIMCSNILNVEARRNEVIPGWEKIHHFFQNEIDYVVFEANFN